MQVFINDTLSSIIANLSWYKYKNTEENKMSWRLRINFDDGSSELIDDLFETEEDAQDEYESWLENYGAGRDVLELAGEDYSDADIIDCDIWEE